MRDTIKPQDYFLARIQADTARIKRFEETLKNTEPSNERGIRLGKSQLSKLYLIARKPHILWVLTWAKCTRITFSP